MSKLDPDEFRELSDADQRRAIHDASSAALRAMIPDAVAVHPDADRKPMVTGEPMVALVDVLRTTGRALPLAVSANGALLEGRERYVAALLAFGRAPETMAVRPAALPRVIQRARIAGQHAEKGDITPAAAACMLASAGAAAAV